jgi:hypothetical protein
VWRQWIEEESDERSRVMALEEEEACERGRVAVEEEEACMSSRTVAAEEEASSSDVDGSGGDRQSRERAVGT